MSVWCLSEHSEHTGSRKCCSIFSKGGKLKEWKTLRGFDTRVQPLLRRPTSSIGHSAALTQQTAACRLTSLTPMEKSSRNGPSVQSSPYQTLTFPPVTEKLANMQYFSFLCPVYVFRHWKRGATRHSWEAAFSQPQTNSCGSRLNTSAQASHPASLSKGCRGHLCPTTTSFGGKKEKKKALNLSLPPEKNSRRNWMLTETQEYSCIQCFGATQEHKPFFPPPQRYLKKK